MIQFTGTRIQSFGNKTFQFS